MLLHLKAPFLSHSNQASIIVYIYIYNCKWSEMFLSSVSFPSPFPSVLPTFLSPFSVFVLFSAVLPSALFCFLPALPPSLLPYISLSVLHFPPFPNKSNFWEFLWFVISNNSWVWKEPSSTICFSFLFSSFPLFSLPTKTCLLLNKGF